MPAVLIKKDRRENAHFSKPREVLVPSKKRFIILSVIINYYIISQLLTDTPCHTADNWGSLKPRNSPIFFLCVLLCIRQMPSLERETCSWSLTRTLTPQPIFHPLWPSHCLLLTPHPYPSPFTTCKNPSHLLLTPRPWIRPYDIHSANLLKVKGLFLLYNIYNYLHVKLYKGAAAYLRNPNPWNK